MNCPSHVSKLILVGMFLFLGGAQAKINYEEGVLEKISDGDTVWVKTKTRPENFLLSDSILELTDQVRGRLKIRMVGMDAAEVHLPTPSHGVVGQGRFGDAGTVELEKLIQIGEEVTVEDHGFDVYKRTLGRLFVGKKDINLAMVKSGWAIPYIICSGAECDGNYVERENVEGYVKACEQAQKSGLGLFNPKDPLKEMPFEFRLRMQERTPDKLVGDFYTRTLYAAEDYRDVDVCSRVFFMKEAEARKAGFEYRGGTKPSPERD